MGMIDRSQLPQKSETLPEAEAEDGDLFVSDVDNQTPAPVVDTHNTLLQDTTASEFRIASESQKSLQSTPASSPSPFQSNLPPAASKAPNPFAAAFQPSKMASSPSNPFATSIPSTTVTPAASYPFTSSPNQFSFSQEPEKTDTSALTTNVAPSPFQTKPPPPQPDTADKPAVSSISPAGPSPSPFASTSSSSSSIFSKPAYAKPKTETPATTTPAPAFSKPSIFPPASSTADKPASVLPNGSGSVLSSGSSPFTAPSPFSFSKPSESTPKPETPAATTPAQSTLFKPSTSLHEASTVDKPASVFSSGAGAFTAPSPFSFSKPSEPTQKLEAPVTTTAAPSTLFTPSNSPPAPVAEPKNPFAPSTFSGANPFGATNISAQSTTLKSDAKPQQPTIASNNPFALPNAPPSFPAVGLGNTAAPSPFQALKAPETAVKAKEPATAPGFGQPFSPFSVNNPSTISESLNAAAGQFPVPGSVFAVPKAPQPSQKADIPATTAPTPENPPLGLSPSLGNLQSPKPSETSVFSQSAPAQAQIPGQTPINGSASISGARRSVSHTQATAPSPPRTLFEALRQPKIFDATSSTYSSETATTQPPTPLFQNPETSVALGQQGSLKRQHEATDANVPHQHKRRSSLKGKAPGAASSELFKRSVHFEEANEKGQPLSQESQVSSVRKKSKVLQKKRVLDEQTEPQPEEQGPSTKVPKVSTEDEYVPFNFSVYKAENRPVPKLPILEKLEEKLARAKALCEPKPLTEEQLQYIEEARLKRARQVDEDEIALSRARILAEKLRTGPGIFDGWTGNIREPWHDPNWNPVARILEKYHARKIPQPISYLPPRLTLNRTARGYEVAYAPDTPDRPMSRTEQRIRRTGARGLAHVPLDFERHKREKEEMAKSQNGRKENNDKDKKDEKEKVVSS